MESNTSVPVQRVDKVNAARRQLATGLELWFGDGDPLSIHTLIAAAHGILADLCRAQGIPDKLLDSDLVKDEFTKQWRAAVRKPANFLKHADDDPEGELEFSPILNDLRPMYCIWCLEALGVKPASTIEHAYMIRVGLEYPKMLKEDMFARTGGTPEDAARLRAMSRSQYLEVHRTAVRFGKAGFSLKVV